MNKQLPERPDLDQLKRQAKDLLEDIRAQRPEALARVPQNERAGFALADAQRVLAREYGFPNWAKFKLHVETREIGIATARLVIAAANGDAASVQAILAERPELARQTVSAAAVLGDLPVLRAWLDKTPEFARTSGGICDTEALGYVSLGRLGGTESDRVACADLLLGHGANPNATWCDRDWPDGRLPILYAATGRNNYPALARRLLAAGANPNDGESIYHAAEHNHVECLQALVAAGGDLSHRDEKWTNTPLYFLIGHVPGTRHAHDARAGIVWLLEHGANPNVTAYEVAETPLFGAIRNGWDLELVGIFLKHGADPQARRADGRSVHAIAVRYGREDVAKLLRAHGAADEAEPEDRFLGALARADETGARQSLRKNPGWKATLATEIGQVLQLAARRGDAAVLGLSARLGLDFDRPDESGQRPLHAAALYGRAAAVRTLVELGADLERIDDTYHGAPLGWCVHGSTNIATVDGDYGAVAYALLAAGAEPLPLRPGNGSPEVLAAFARHAKK
jgi:ankyrin repeat protein